MSWHLLYALDLFGLALFALSYYLNCYRRGYRFDFWHAQLFLICVFPNLIMLPFARNEMNAIVVGRDHYAIVAVLPYVFLVTFVGYLAVLAGGMLWQFRLGLGIRKATVRVLDVVPHCSMMLMSSRSILVFQAMVCLLLQAAILSVYFSANGFGFDLRSYTFAHPELRPVALLIAGYSILISSHCLARYVDKKEKILLACTLLITTGMVFFGARSSIASMYIGVLMCYLVKLRDRISLIRIFAIAFGLIFAALYLGSLRAGQFSFSVFWSGFLLAVFFGNNFSDLRDFAWVYAYWNHQHWLGKTYLAALMSFVPRFASSFRDTWGLGVATATTLGFDPHVHPGVRPGSFGEGYFNFGLIGVILVGLAVGIILRRVDMDVKRAFASPQPSMMKAFASTMLLAVLGAITLSAAFSGMYVLGGIYLFTWVCLQVQRPFQVRRAGLAT